VPRNPHNGWYSAAIVIQEREVSQGGDLATRIIVIGTLFLDGRQFVVVTRIVRASKEFIPLIG
jgi:hypothetical protein